MKGWHGESMRHSLAARGIRTSGIRDDFPTSKDFLRYHKTGTIKSGAFESFRTIEGIKWLGDKDEYPVFIKNMIVNGETIEFRGRLSHDPEYIYSIVAFNELEQPIGWVANAFGYDGVWVVDDYQNKGIGLELLYEFRKYYPSTRRIGQMTYTGTKLVESYYQRLLSEEK